MIVAPGSPHKQTNQHDSRDDGRDHHAAHSAAAVSTSQIVTVQVVTVQIIVKHLVFLLEGPEKQQAPITNVPRQWMMGAAVMASSCTNGGTTIQSSSRTLRRAGIRRPIGTKSCLFLK